jgi:hypothetical protein
VQALVETIEMLEAPVTAIDLPAARSAATRRATVTPRPQLRPCTLKRRIETLTLVCNEAGRATDGETQAVVPLVAAKPAEGRSSNTAAAARNATALDLAVRVGLSGARRADARSLRADVIPIMRSTSLVKLCLLRTLK